MASPRVRLTIEELQQLKAMGFTHMAVIESDVSVVMPGSVDAVFSRKHDVDQFVARMNEIYGDRAYSVREI